MSIESYKNDDDNCIEITVSDSGCGISKDQIKYIFDPFFTTKSPNKGMGMGLSIARRIIENHKGAIYASSEEGKGSQFKVILPASID